MGSKKVWCLPREVVEKFREIRKGIIILPEPTDCLHEGMIKKLQKYGKLLDRKKAEGNKNWVQIVVGGLVVAFDSKKKKRGLLVIERFETEERLQGLWTAYVGGHLEDIDILGEAMREIEEELKVDDYFVSGTSYGIWYPVDDVSEEHLGIIYVFYVRDEDIRNSHLKYRIIDMGELKELNKDSWTQALDNGLGVLLDGL